MNALNLSKHLATARKLLGSLHRQGSAKTAGPQTANWLRTLAGLSSALNQTRDSALSLAQHNRQLSRTCRALETEQRRYRQLFECAPDGYLVTDAQGRILEANRAAGLLFKRNRVQLAGKHLALFIDEGQRRAFREHLRRLDRGREEFNCPEGYRIKLNSGAFQEVTMSVSTARGANGHLSHMGWLMRGTAVRRRSAAEDRATDAGLERNREALRALTARLLQAQDEERRRVSRELHDDLCQRLAVLILEIETLERNLPLSHLQILEQLRSFRERVSDLSDEARHLAYRLHPSVLEDLGLAAAMRSFIKDFAAREGIQVRLVRRNLPRPLPLETASCLYRVMQESLRNAAKHARTRRISVTLTGSARSIRLSVKDWGMGFDPESLKSKHNGLGIVGMEERVRQARGTFCLWSGPGKGTQVVVRLPLPEEAR
jgi:PAS domain S-box-containing protein